MVTGVARRGGGWQSRVDGAAQWGDVVARRPRLLAALTTLPAAGGWRRAGRMARCPHGTVYTDGAVLAWTAT